MKNIFYYIRGWWIFSIYPPGTYVYHNDYRCYFKIVEKNVIVSKNSSLMNISNVESGKYLEPIVCF